MLHRARDPRPPVIDNTRARSGCNPHGYRTVAFGRPKFRYIF